MTHVGKWYMGASCKHELSQCEIVNGKWSWRMEMYEPECKTMDE